MAQVCAFAEMGFGDVSLFFPGGYAVPVCLFPDCAIFVPAKVLVGCEGEVGELFAAFRDSDFGVGTDEADEGDGVFVHVALL